MAGKKAKTTIKCSGSGASRRCCVYKKGQTQGKPQRCFKPKR